jgi:2-oxoglutarate ferredoxin oxidoreductase subunit delta
MIRIEIDPAWCKGCYLCVSFCPREVLAIDYEHWSQGVHPVYVKDIEHCTVCRNCELLCPDLAIEVKED